VSHGLVFRLRRRSCAALRRKARPHGYAGVVALRSSLTLPRFPVLLRCGNLSDLALLRLVWVAGHSDLTQVVMGSPDLTTNGEVGSRVNLPATR